MILAKMYSHFDKLLVKCVTKEALEYTRPKRLSKGLENAWMPEVDTLEELLDCMKVACP